MVVIGSNGSVQAERADTKDGSAPECARGGSDGWGVRIIDLLPIVVVWLPSTDGSREEFCRKGTEVIRWAFWFKTSCHCVTMAASIKFLGRLRLRSTRVI